MWQAVYMKIFSTWGDWGHLFLMIKPDLLKKATVPLCAKLLLTTCFDAHSSTKKSLNVEGEGAAIRGSQCFAVRINVQMTFKLRHYNRFHGRFLQQNHACKQSSQCREIKCCGWLITQRFKSFTVKANTALWLWLGLSLLASTLCCNVGPNRCGIFPFQCSFAENVQGLSMSKHVLFEGEESFGCTVTMCRIQL